MSNLHKKISRAAHSTLATPLVRVIKNIRILVKIKPPRKWAVSSLVTRYRMVTSFNCHRSRKNLRAAVFNSHILLANQILKAQAREIRKRVASAKDTPSRQSTKTNLKVIKAAKPKTRKRDSVCQQSKRKRAQVSLPIVRKKEAPASKSWWINRRRSLTSRGRSTSYLALPYPKRMWLKSVATTAISQTDNPSSPQRAETPYNKIPSRNYKPPST